VVLGARGEEVKHLEIHEVREISEEEGMTTPNSFPDCFVELNNAEVTLGLVLGEHLRDELCVLSELIHPEWEDESVSLLSSSPCSDPVSSRFNRSSKVKGHKGELKLSDFLRVFVGGLGVKRPTTH
jgi:hypothetical protein